MVEAIHLKNGSVIKGVIIEQIPDKQITIRTSDGSTFVYPMEDISKITKEEKESKIPFKISNEKYDLTGSRFMIDLGYWAGGYKGPELYFTYGSQINQYLFVGGGTGIHYMTDYSTVSIPIFADVRGYALNGPISPFIALRIGYKFNTKEAPRHAKKGGLYCNPFIGVRFMTTKKQAVNLGIGYSIQKVSFDEEWGDVKGYVLEKKVAFTKKYKDESREDEDCEEWEEVDSCWGCYEETDELIKEVMIENGLEE